MWSGSFFRREANHIGRIESIWNRCFWKRLEWVFSQCLRHIWWHWSFWSGQNCVFYQTSCFFCLWKDLQLVLMIMMMRMMANIFWMFQLWRMIVRRKTSSRNHMTNIFNCMDVTYSSNKVALKSIICSSFCFINKNVSTESMIKALFWTFYLTICLLPGFFSELWW